MADTTFQDVDDIYEDREMTESDAHRLVEMANRLADDVFGGRLRTLSEIEGDQKDFKTLLAAHIWAIREGEIQSENLGGATSVTYTWMSGRVEDTLSETRYGRIARLYIRDNASIGIIRSDI